MQSRISTFDLRPSTFDLRSRKRPLVTLCALAFALPAHAQQGEAAPIDAARNQVPTAQDPAAEAAEFLAKNFPAAPLPAGSTRLDAMRERAANLQKQHAAYLADIAAGKILPHAHLHEIRPQLVEDLKILTTDLEHLTNESDPVKKQALSKAYFAALQPLGPHLETADPGQGHTQYLEERQQAELARLEQAWDAADKAPDTAAPPLHIVGPGLLYTITRLSVPIVVQAPPSSKVIFQSFGGGCFTNQLAFIEVEADAAGIARTEWVSYGDAIGDNVIGVRSQDAPPAENLTVTIVQLKLSPLPELPNNPEVPNSGQ